MDWSILLVEDNPGDALLARKALEAVEACEVVHVETLEDAIAALAERAFDVVLLDLNLPGSSGLETIRAVTPHNPPPIIALTGMDNHDLGVEALREGAQDFLTKRSADGPTMWRSIIHSVERASLQAAHAAVFEQSEVGIAILAEGRTVLANPAAATLVGLRPGQPAPPWTERRPGERTAHDPEPRVTALSWQPTSWQGTPATLLRARDVTQQRAQERALREQERRFQDLERLHALGRVSGGLAHRINNLLVAIRGNAQLLDEPGRSDPVRGILQAAEEMAGVVQHMLAFAGEQPRSGEQVSLNEALRGVPLQAHLGEDVEVVLDLDPTVQDVPLSGPQVSQILVALTENAGAAMGGVGRFEVTTHAGREVILQITDDGSGMDAGTLEQAFDPFFSTDPMHSGLGLSAVHGIVTRAGGSLQLESELGRGTRVRLYLPSVERKAELPTPSSPGSGVILIAEDDELVRELVVRCLRRERGLTLLSAKDGVVALEIAKSRHIDVLLTDMRMPRMGGAELYQRLAETRPGLPVVFMSGYTAVGLPPEADGPHSAFIPKPFKVADLRGAILRMLALAVSS